MKHYSQHQMTIHEIRTCVLTFVYKHLPITCSLYEYPFDDLKFKPEGSAENWCGNELRSCSSCSVTPTSGIDVSWDSCITRLMTPRLALRMRKLANVAKRLSLGIA